MGPVKLNKDHSINKAGVEVDVIPIMRSPCPSPKPRKKRPTPRSKSAMGYYKSDRLQTDECGSLPDLKSSSLKGSLVNIVMQLDPQRFLSTQSLISGESGIRSLESTERFPKGTIMKAVVNWLEESSPFSSIENLDKRSVTSMLDPMETSFSSLMDDELESTDERSVSKSDCVIPEINIYFEDGLEQGADTSTSSASARDTTAPSTSRPEGEEGAEREETEYERRVADQHQLSEEMKQLLKELEKETKQ